MTAERDGSGASERSDADQLAILNSRAIRGLLDWSPDGAGIAFTLGTSDPGSPPGEQVAVLPSSGAPAAPRALADDARDPAYRQDGLRIGFRSDPGRSVGTVGPAGAAEQRTVLGDGLAASEGPVWSPRGDELLVVVQRDQDFRGALYAVRGTRCGASPTRPSTCCT